MISKRESEKERDGRKLLKKLIMKTSLQYVADSLDRDPSTIYRWLRKGLTPLQKMAIQYVPLRKRGVE